MKFYEKLKPLSSQNRKRTVRKWTVKLRTGPANYFFLNAYQGFLVA